MKLREITQILEQVAPLFYQESYASPSAGDFDNDGNLDLFFTTVYGTASFGKKNNAVLLVVRDLRHEPKLTLIQLWLHDAFSCCKLLNVGVDP